MAHDEPAQLSPPSPLRVLLVTAFVLATVAVSTVTSCPLGWSAYNQTKCLKYIAVNVNHSEAVRMCSEYNSTLASVHGRDEEDFILSLGRQFYTLSGVHWVWVGATRPSSTSDLFVWSDGSNLDYTNWRPGCPDQRAGENCVLMTVFRDRPSHWCNFKCDSNYDHVICQRPWTNDTEDGLLPLTTLRPYTRRYPTRFPMRYTPGRFTVRPRTTTARSSTRGTRRPQSPACDAGWDFYGTKCYKFMAENVTGEQAPFICRRAGGQTLTIESEAEQTWAVEFGLIEHESKEAIWLSGRRNGSGIGDFVWKTMGGDRPMTYQSWSGHEPDNRMSKEECVAMNDMAEFYGRWMDAPCSVKFHLICERASRALVTPEDEDNEVEGDGDGVTQATSAMDAVAGRVASESTDDKKGDSKSEPAATVLLTMLVVTLSLFVATLLIVIYSQRRRLSTIIGESRLKFGYLRRAPSLDTEPEYSEPIDAIVRRGGHSSSSAGHDCSSSGFDLRGKDSGHMRSDSATLIWTTDAHS